MYTNCGDPLQAILEWKQLNLHGIKANEFTYSAALNACSKIRNIEVGEGICQELTATTRSTILETSIVKFYLECGKPKMALEEWQHVYNGTVVLDDLLTCYFLMACAALRDLEMTNSIARRLVRCLFAIHF